MGLAMTEAAINPTNGLVTPWTDERIDQLAAMWAAGESATRIAAELGGGITKNSAIGKARRLGLAPHVTKASSTVARTPRQANRDRGLRQSIDHRSRRKPQPPTVAKEPEPVVEFLGIRLLDIGYRQCRFPRGEGADITFCGQITAPNRSFCPHCHRIVYQRVAA